MRFSNSNVQPTSFDCNGCVIGQRTQSDWIADAIRSGGGCLQGGCTCLKCTNKAIKYPTKLSSAPISFL